MIALVQFAQSAEVAENTAVDSKKKGYYGDGYYGGVDGVGCGCRPVCRRRPVCAPVCHRRPVCAPVCYRRPVCAPVCHRRPVCRRRAPCDGRGYYY